MSGFCRHTNMAGNVLKISTTSVELTRVYTSRPLIKNIQNTSGGLVMCKKGSERTLYQVLALCLTLL